MSNEEATHQRLRAAVHYTTGRMCQEIGAAHGVEMSRQVTAAVAEATFRQCEQFAKDLEAFARHAKRSTVTPDDVKLIARRSTALANFIQRKNDELIKDPKHVKKNAWKKSNKDQEDSDAAPL